MRQVRDATRRLANGHYDERVAEPGELELAELARDVNRLAVELETTERRRARLVSEVAHEMRTPLTTIEGYVEGMLDGVFEPNEEVLVAVGEEASRLQRLASDLADLSRSEEGAVALHLRVVDLGELAAASAERLRPQFDEKGVALVVAGGPPLPVEVDPDRIAQVLTNLFGNALDLHPGRRAGRGARRVGTTMSRRSPSATPASGSHPKTVALVFDRFYRVQGPLRPAGRKRHRSDDRPRTRACPPRRHRGDVAGRRRRISVHPHAPDGAGRGSDGPMSSESRIVKVMGTTAHLIVTDGPSGLVDRGVDRLDELEARWSRFLPDSEISRLNDRPGVPVLVSKDTYRLIDHALAGWRLTEGRFDPTLLREVRAAGYDRSFELLDANQSLGGPVPPPVEVASAVADSPRSGANEIALDPIVGSVTLGPDVQLDPGGIGKGLAADLVVDLLLAEGARGALVNVGGDLRVAGAPPEGDGWVVAIEDPTDADRMVDTISLDAGAVASTWRTKRAWTAPDGTPRHHLIDPKTGLSAASGLAGVAVLTGRGWRAEVLAKAAFLAGPVDGAALLAANDAAGLLVADDGTVSEAGAWARFRV